MYTWYTYQSYHIISIYTYQSKCNEWCTTHTHLNTFPQAWKHRSDSGSGIWSRQHCQVIISQPHPSLSFWWISDKPLTMCKVLYHKNLILSCSIYVQSLQLTLEWKDLRPTQFWLWFYSPYNCSCFSCLQRVIYWSTLLSECGWSVRWRSTLNFKPDDDQ